MMLTHSRRRGVALLEVLAATTILFLSIAGWLTLMTELRHASQDAERREIEVQRAASALSLAMSLPVDSLLASGTNRVLLGFRVVATPRTTRTWTISVVDTDSRAIVLESVLRAPAERAR